METFFNPITRGWKPVVACASVTLWLCHALCLPAVALELIASQMGYHPNTPKVLYLKGYKEQTPPKVTFYDPKAPGLLPGMIGKVVFKEATVTPELVQLPESGKVGPGVPLWRVQFDGFTQQGTYDIRVNNLPQPDLKPVVISEFTFWDAMVPVLRSLYLSRSGSKVLYEGVEPPIERSASHLKDAYMETYLNTGKETIFRDVTGGWYNGGPDYAKYTPTTAYAVSLWLLAYQQAPLPWKTFKLGYPFMEPNQGDVRDILHELKVGLNWLMAMQRADGQVYHQVNGHQPVGDVRPDEDFQTRTLSGLYPQDTAMAATAFAMAARAYQRSDVGYSVKCLMAAQRAWQALVNMPAQQKLATRGVPYVTTSDIPYRFNAAMALYLATGDATYQEAAQLLLPLLRKSTPTLTTLSWEQPTLLVALQAQMQEEAPQGPHTKQRERLVLVPTIQSALQPATTQARARLQQWLERTSLALYPAESEPNLALLGPLSVLLAQATPNLADWQLAAQAMARVAGLNGYATSFIAGVGHNAVQHPGTLLAHTLRRPLPGLVVSGPAQNMPYVDTWQAPANHAELATTAQWGWVLSRLNWGFNQLEIPSPAK